MAEQGRCIRAALSGLPYVPADSTSVYSVNVVPGSRSEGDLPMPIGHGSAWAPKKKGSVDSRSRSPFTTPTPEPCHLPPKPCDAPPSYVAEPQAQEWPALGETRLASATTPSAGSNAARDTAAPGFRYSEVAGDTSASHPKPNDAIRPGRWGQLGKSSDVGKPMVIAPKPVRVGAGSKRSPSQASNA